MRKRVVWIFSILVVWSWAAEPRPPVAGNRTAVTVAHVYVRFYVGYIILLFSLMIPVVLSCLSPEEASGARELHRALAEGTWRRAARRHFPRPSASSHVALSLFLSFSLSLFLLLPSFLLYRGCRSVGTSPDRLFPFADSCSQLLLAARRSGGDTDGSILMSPCLLGRDVGEQVEKDLYTQTHTQTHTDTQREHTVYTHTHTNRIPYKHSHACMCGELSHTFFPFTLWTLTWHSCPQTLEQSAEEHKGSRPPPPRTTSTTTYWGDHVGYCTHKQTHKHFAKSTQVFPLTNLLLSRWRSHRNDF